MVAISLRYLKGIPHSRYTVKKALFKVKEVLGPALMAQELLERKRYFLLRGHANFRGQGLNQGAWI